MPSQIVTFIIGGESVEVGELHWDVLEDVVFPILDDARARDQAGVQLPWWRSRSEDIRILAAAIGRPYDEVRSKLTQAESVQVSARMRDLLTLSGFTLAGEADPAGSDSTETSIDSSPGS